MQMSKGFFCAAPFSLVLSPINIAASDSNLSLRFRDTTVLCLRFPSLCHSLKCVSRQETGASTGVIFCFLSLRANGTHFPIVQCMKFFVDYALSSFLGLFCLYGKEQV